MSADRVVVDFDHHTKEYAENHDAILEKMREQCPHAVWSENHGGYWAVIGHDAAKKVLGDNETFSSAKLPDGSRGKTVPSVGPRLIPAECDPPLHTTLRRVLAPMFNRPAAERLLPEIERCVGATLDRVIEMGEFDGSIDIADHIAPGVVVAYLGFPEEDREGLIHAVQLGMHTDPTPEGERTKIEALGGIVGKIGAFIASRRAERAEDLVSYLVHHPDLAELTDEDFIWLIFTLLLGGMENTTAWITNTLVHLDEDRQLRRTLIEQPTLIPKAGDELLRFYSPAVSLGYTAAVDTEVCGVGMRAGERVLVMVPGANHDPGIFDDPGAVDITRNTRPHLGFGFGPHFCPGAPLARLEYRVFLEQVLTRIPDYSLHRDRCARVDDAGIMNGWRNLPGSTNR